MEDMKIMPPEATEVEVVDIQFRPGQKIYYFDPNGILCKTGDHVIIDTARGPEYGICAGGNHTIPTKDVVAPLRPVLRIATAQDERVVAENRQKEKRALTSACRKSPIISWICSWFPPSMPSMAAKSCFSSPPMSVWTSGNW